MSSREAFEAWWVRNNDGEQPRSGWESLRGKDGYCDESLDLQWEGWQAATNVMVARFAALAVENDNLRDVVKGIYPNISLGPATGDFLAEARAQGVEMLAAEADQLMDEFGDDSYKVMVAADLQRFANAFAAQLRKGGAA